MSFHTVHEPPHEEEDGHDRERTAVGRRGARRHAAGRGGGGLGGGHGEILGAAARRGNSGGADLCPIALPMAKAKSALRRPGAFEDHESRPAVDRSRQACHAERSEASNRTAPAAPAASPRILHSVQDDMLCREGEATHPALPGTPLGEGIWSASSQFIPSFERGGRRPGCVDPKLGKRADPPDLIACRPRCLSD